MPMKPLKTEIEKELTVERILHARRCSPTLDKIWCTGCGICMEICPREAVETEESLKQMEKKLARREAT